MQVVRIAAVTAMAGWLCGGCSYWSEQAQTVYKGQARIEDEVFLLQKNDPKAADLPKACGGGQSGLDPDDWTNAKPDGQDHIRACTFAMKLLIDIRWSRFSDALQGSVGYGSMTLDTITLGLNTAGALTPGSANQILSAVAAGVGGFKTKLNEDILYRNSVEMILLQMEKDRAAEATVILAKLNANGYRTMREAAVDLYAYNRAGSWTNALISMQADSGNTAADTKASLQAAELNAAQAGSPPAAPAPSP